MPDSQLYRFFLDKGSNQEGIFLFFVKLEPQLRPKVGDSITQPLTLQNFRIMRDEIPTSTQNSIRITDNVLIRITDQGDIRVTGAGISPVTLDTSTHDYFIIPANNPNRISTWTTSRFDDDRALKQLFR